MAQLCIVEDDESLRSTLSMLLESIGIGEYVTAANLNDLKTHEAEVPGMNAAIVDVNLGAGQPDGIDVATWLYEKKFRGKLIFISGHARTNPRIEAACHIRGATFIQKPFQIDELEALVKGVA